MLVSFVFKGFRKILEKLIASFYTPCARLIFYLNNVSVSKGLKVNGIIQVHVTRRGVVSIGKNFHINSGNRYNVIGRQQKSIIWTEGQLIIGENVGISSTAIICNFRIEIGNNVKMGGNTVIYDTDFHNLNPEIRAKSSEDKKTAHKAAVVIKDNVFIGAHSTILKGVVIGENSVIGACSVVTKSIPANEIWGGNPAKKIKDLNQQ